MRLLALTTLLAGLLALPAIWPGPATAAPAQCSTKIEGEPVTIFYDDEEPTYSSFRERVFSRR
ncbi:MAG: hypothetical protein V2I53_10075, partial [Paracoccaceae bacterium]|nr:hypothetical protein [Paracoccaceae bacterium]